jgi:hypothetical protein
VGILQIGNNNFSSNKYQLQAAEKMIKEAGAKRNQASELYSQADKLQGQAQVQEETGKSLEKMANRESLNVKEIQREGVTLEIKGLSFNKNNGKASESSFSNMMGTVETMNKIKTLFQAQPQKTLNVQNKNTPKSVSYLLR